MKTLQLSYLRFAVIFVALLVCEQLHAQITWDSNTTTTGAQDGPGTWNTSNSNWWTGSANRAFVSGDNIIVGAGSGAAGTITVDAGGVTAGTLTFNAPGSGSYTFTGGSITGGALIKNGNNGLRFDNSNSFSTITINGGPNTNTDGAIRLGNANALGTGVGAGNINLTNSSNMTALYFVGSGFGNGTLSNAIAMSIAAGTYTTRLTTGVSNTATLSGVISGGTASQTLLIDNDSGTNDQGDIRLTNAANSFTVSRIQMNRGGLIFTSDGALGNAGNDLFLDVTSDQASSGLQFGADNIVLNSGRALTVQSQTVIDTQPLLVVRNGSITFTGNVVKRGTGDLRLNGAGSGAGGVSVVQGTVSAGIANAVGTEQSRLVKMRLVAQLGFQLPL